MLLSIQGGSNLGLYEINDAARLVAEAVHPDANIIFGAVIDDSLGDEVRVTVIAAGFDESRQRSFSSHSGSPDAEPADAKPAAVAQEPEELWLLPGEQERAAAQEQPVFAAELEDDSDLDVPDFLR